ncbi:MAG: sigma-70 family RNA polymerase sigma factor [Moorea sp. SIO3C2]|nr:sigma-70 family RNA polymerase sigma factor [Moorena sp. SIO3C2]
MSGAVTQTIREASAMKQDTDGLLVQRLWSGDLSAMEILYDRYGRLVYGLALKGLRRVADAEDLTQDVFLTLMRSRTYDSQRGSLASYLTTLTRSRVIDRLRSRSTRQKYFNRWQQSVADAATVEPVTPMKHLTQQEQRDLVRTALTRLKAQQRQVLELSYYEGQSHREIAVTLGVPLGTVKSWARRGLLQLRKQLDALQLDALGEDM